MRIPTVQLKADKNKCEAIIDGTKGSMVPVYGRDKDTYDLQSMMNSTKTLILLTSAPVGSGP